MKWIWILGLFWTQLLKGQAIHYIHNSLYGPAAVTPGFSDPLMVAQQPAALAQLPTAGGMLFSESAFGLKELRNLSFSLNLPLQHSGIGLMVNSSGTSEFSENRFSFSYGRLLGKLSVGIQFNYTQIKAIGTVHALSPGIGICWWVSPRLGLGITVIDVAGTGLEKIYEKLAWCYKTGFFYELSDKVALSVSVVKKEQLPVFLETGLIYKWQERFYFRAGIRETAYAPFISSGWGWKNFQLECSASLHPQLGISPGLLLLYSTSKKKS